jgi:C4-dicarboxylate transporter DctM subunit
VPIVFPVIVQLGFDPIWFGVIIVMTVEIGLIHPPVGMNVFVIKSMVPDIDFTTIFKGVLPFVAALIFALIVIVVFPQMATWLPSRM